ncbi:MAG: hypothetical protein QNK18_13920 [Gammaproteobacteria bacterium]|nr:hypothetical protein [Gammaproteobacteria bacterium]
MKKFALTLGILALSTSAFADISSGNSDLHGWAVEDRNLRSVTQREYQEPVLPFSAPDQYGGILFNESPAYSENYSANPGTVGVGDSYGSILHSIGFSY